MNTDDVRGNVGLDAELHQLALDGLAAHLGAAGRVDRLLQLFGDDRRLRRRVTAEVRLWDGYQSDIDTAWDAVDRALAEDPGRVPDPLGGCIRLALLRGSMKAADDIPSRVVVAAVATGLWSAQRALSTIGRAASAGEQADGYYRLLALAPIDAATRKTVQARIVALASLPGDEIPARTLLEGVALLDAGARAAVAAGIEETAPIVSWQVPARFASKRIRPEGLEAGEAVALLCAVPEIRRPRLVERVAEALLDDLAGLTREDAEPPPADGGDEPLLAQLQRDSFAWLIDPRHRLVRAGQALAELAALLVGHPARERFVERLGTLVAEVRDAETRSRLADAYGLTLPGEGGGGPPASDVTDDPATSGAADGPDAARARRLSLVRDVVHRLTSPLPEPSASPLSTAPTDSGDATLDELTLRWFAERQPPYVERREPQDDPEGDGKREFRAFTRRAGGPAVIASLLTVQELSDDTVGAMIDAVYLPRELPGQMALVELLTKHKDLADTTAAVRKVKGHLLRCALAHTPVSPHAAWDGLSAEQLRDADFRPVLDFALGLPAEQRRSAYWHTAMGRGIPLEVRTVPRLAALALLLPHLDTGQLAEAFADVLAVEDSEVRLLGLELFGPYLGAEQVARAVDSLRAAPDAREVAWLLGELAALLDPSGEERGELEERAADVIARVDAGADLAEAVLRRLHRTGLPLDAASLGSETAALLHRMDPNNRLDAVLVLLSGTEGALTADLAAQIIGLPVVNDRTTYSCRGFALVAAAERFADDWIPAAWYAAQELPRRLSIGDAPAWGWDWRYEYPYAAAVEALVPRLRGPLARQAFEAAKDMPWEPRERIMRLLADHADDGLSRDLFDHATAVHRSYQELPDTAEPPFPLEGTVVTQSAVNFKGLREVQLAELTAAVVTRLDAGRLAEAARLAREFSNCGPRAWLPGKLLPALADRSGLPAPAAELRAALIASGTVAAMEFIAGETDRLDLLAELLPHLREATEEQAAPVREFVIRHVPRHGSGFLLSRDEIASLDSERTEEYFRLLGVEDRAEVEAGLSGDADHQRRFLVRVILRPFFAGSLEQTLTQLLVDAPVLARAAVLDATAELLDPGNHRAIVDHTVAQLLGEPMEEKERLEALGAILPSLTQAQRDELVEIATHPDVQGVRESRDVSRKVFALLLDDLRTPAHADGRFSRVRHNRYAHTLRNKVREDRVMDALGLVHGGRAEFLAVLAENLTEAAARRLAERVAHLPDLERADVSVTLLPLLSGEARAALVAGVRGLTDPFARFWAAFAGQEELDGDADPSWAGFVHDTAMAFEGRADQAAQADRAGACACLLLLVGYADADTRKTWCAWVISRLGGLPDEDALRVTAGLAAVVRDDDALNAALVDAVCSRQADGTVHAGALILARHGVDLSALTEPRRTRLHALLSRRLRGLADRGRPDLLVALAAESPLIGALSTQSELSAIARGVHEVCFTWRWP
ncbi:hypothetical protein ABZ953_18850 [Streptomyces sp. NPDC046465]|uniref:hypothetical protein n=1 Tax=Streptomyces sp. NPDC046465 TaxID=3155810 RepID=UPI00340BD17D